MSSYRNAADGLNTALYAKEGDWKNVALCGASCVAGILSLEASSLASSSLHAAGLACKVSKAASIVDAVTNVAMLADNAVALGKTIGNVYTKCVVEGKTISVKDVAAIGVGVLGLVAGAKGTARGLSRSGVIGAKKAGTSLERASEEISEGGKGSRGLLSDYLGKPVGFDNGKMYSIKNEAGGQVYVSTQNIVQSDIADIVSKTKGKINIISGRHGDWMDSIVLEPNFYTQDVKRFGNMEGINVYDFGALTSEELLKLTNSSDTTILGWCFSEYGSFMREGFK